MSTRPLERPRYTDLERLRVDWFIENTRLTVAEIAEKIGRPAPGLRQNLYRRGIWINEERNGERAWSSR